MIWTVLSILVSSVFLVALRNLLTSTVCVIRGIWIPISSLILITFTSTWVRVFLLFLIVVSLEFECKASWATIEPRNHMILEVRFCSFQKSIELVVARKFDNLNHLSRISDSIKNIQVIEVTEINNSLERLIHHLPIKVDDDLLMFFGSWWFNSDLGCNIVAKKLGKNKTLVWDYSHMALDFHCGLSLALLFPEVIKLFLSFVFWNRFLCVWRSIILRVLSRLMWTWVNSDFWILNVLTRLFHFLVRIAILAHLLLVWRLFIEGLVKTFKNYICIKSIYELLIDIFE